MVGEMVEVDAVPLVEAPDKHGELKKLFDLIVAEAEKVEHWTMVELRALKAKL